MGRRIAIVTGSKFAVGKIVRAALIVALLTIVSMGVAASNDRKSVLKVGATILPPPCQHPAPCKPVPATARTRMSYHNGIIHYVGSPPRVARKGDLVTIIF